jgi:hypothetical protein
MSKLNCSDTKIKYIHAQKKKLLDPLRPLLYITILEKKSEYKQNRNVNKKKKMGQ